MADTGANPHLPKCESCKRDLSKLRTIYCSECEKPFNADLHDEGGDQDAFCPHCGNSLFNNPDTVLLIPEIEERKMLCKYCLDEAQRSSPVAMADDGPNTLPRCESCKRDLSKLRSAVCSKCDKTFNADLPDEGGDHDAFCPLCGDTVLTITEERMRLCKYCLDEAGKTGDPVGTPRINFNDCQNSSSRLRQEVHHTELLRCTSCGASSKDNFLPVNFSDLSWTARCFRCRENFNVKDDFATCPKCGVVAEDLTEPSADSVVMICRQCTTPVHKTQTVESETAVGPILLST